MRIVALALVILLAGCTGREEAPGNDPADRDGTMSDASGEEGSDPPRDEAPPRNTTAPPEGSTNATSPSPPAGNATGDANATLADPERLASGEVVGTGTAEYEIAREFGAITIGVERNGTTVPGTVTLSGPRGKTYAGPPQSSAGDTSVYCWTITYMETPPQGAWTVQATSATAMRWFVWGTVDGDPPAGGPHACAP